MFIPFSGNEFVDIAIGIERDGIAFYELMAESTKNAVPREFFKNLADSEREHIKIFQGMLAEADMWQMPEANTQEYTVYLRALVSSTIFTDEKITSKVAADADNHIKALELAISAEKDSVLFYNEMKEVTSQHAQVMINKIITEEKSHLEKLSVLKNKLTAIQ
jgi:rubrerythrin